MTNHPEDALRALESKMRKFSARGDTNEQWADELAAILRQIEAAPSPPDSSQGEPVAWGRLEMIEGHLVLCDYQDVRYNRPWLSKGNDLYHHPLYTTPPPSSAKWYDEQNSNVEEVSGMGAGSSDYQCAQVAVAEPTEAMLEAAREWSHEKYGKPIGNDAAIGCYKVMLAAAPQSAPKAAEPQRWPGGD